MRLTNPASNWPTGNGELAALIRNFDWSQTSLGPSSAWPAYVRNCVDTILLSPIAIATMWNQDAVMIYNDAYAEIAGKRHPAILGSQALLSWPEIADFNRSVVQQVLAGGTLKFIDQELTVHRNGMPEQIWLDLYYSPILDHQSRPCAVLAMVMENTRRVLAERQRDRVEGELLASNEALRRANEDLEQFAFSASHDLQEPVRMMALYNQLLRRKLKGKLDAETELLLNNCGNGALRLEDLLKDLLEYTHLSSKEDAPPAVIVFPQVMEKLASNLEPSIDESGAAITWDEFPALKMQSIHLYQLLRNLLSNAIKYHSDKPLEVHVGAARQDSGWVFSVRDNGIGIEPAYQKQIFGLFKRLHTNSDYPGTGLGLAICKKLVERYGGTIWVESKPGSGSTFYFTLPLAIAG